MRSRSRRDAGTALQGGSPGWAARCSGTRRPRADHGRTRHPPATAFREGLYRRTLALADALAAGLVVLVVLPLLASAAPPAWPRSPPSAPSCSSARSAASTTATSSSSRRRRSTRRRALLQIAALYTLVLWLFHDGFTSVVLERQRRHAPWGRRPSSAAPRLACAARGSPRRVAAPERCLVVGDARGDRAVAAEDRSAGRVNAEVVASLALDAADRVGRSSSRRFARAHPQPRRPPRRSSRRHGAGRETLDLIRDREVRRRAGQPAAAHARGRRLLGRVRPPRRPDDARRPPLRPLALVARAQARASTSPARRSCSSRRAAVLAIALAIRLDCRGPVLFRQTRVGKDGERFEMLKFRTMVDDADEPQGGAAPPQRDRAGCSRSPTTRASRASGASCAAPRSTSCRSSSTSGAAR